MSMGFAGGIATIYDGATCPSTQTLVSYIFWVVCEVKNIIAWQAPCVNLGEQQNE